MHNCRAYCTRENRDVFCSQLFSPSGQHGPDEALTIPKEWIGVSKTDGYTKIRVIYSEDESGL